MAESHSLYSTRVLMARVVLLVSTRSLGALDYRVPRRLVNRIEVGSAVVAPLSGHSRVGVVVGLEEGRGELRELRELASPLSVTRGVVDLCHELSDLTALPLPEVVRRVMPPGVSLERFEVVDPHPEWPWRKGEAVSRSALRRELGRDAATEADREGRVRLVPRLPGRQRTEWAVWQGDIDVLERAPSQRLLARQLKAEGGECPGAELLRKTGVRRDALRRLVSRGAVRLVERAEALPILAARGGQDPGYPDISRRVSEGGELLWRAPSSVSVPAAAAAVRGALSRWTQSLVLVPGVEDVGRVLEELKNLLPTGATIAPYHSGLGADRAAIYDAVRQGAVDVVVGTRSAATLPLSRPGLICMLAEHADAHRAADGYEGLPLHAREIASLRSRLERMTALFVSPVPSLALYSRPAVSEIPAPPHRSLSRTTVVDMRVSGESLGSEVIQRCRKVLEDGGRVGLVAHRTGYAHSLFCARCGRFEVCSACSRPLMMHSDHTMICLNCGVESPAPRRCPSCGSRRMRPSGLAAGRLRRETRRLLGTRVGLMTADEVEDAETPVVVGTASVLLRNRWDLLALPNVDALLTHPAIGGGERAFRTVFLARESCDELVLQTRLPENGLLAHAINADFPSFAAEELARLKSAGYPPFTRLASLELRGKQEEMSHAVESVLKPAIGPEARLLGTAYTGDKWRVALCASDLRAVAAAADTARTLLGNAGFEVKVRIDAEEI